MGRAWPLRLAGLGLALAPIGCAGPVLHPGHMLPPVDYEDRLQLPGDVLVPRATGGGPPGDGRTIDAVTFTAALVDALRLAGVTVVTDDDAQTTLLLRAELLWQDQQEVFVDPRVTVAVRYTLRRRASTAPSWERVIVASAPTMLDGVLAESERLHRGNEDAVRENLAKLLAALGRVRWVGGDPLPEEPESIDAASAR